MKKIDKTRERLTGEDNKDSAVLFNRHLATYLYSISYINGEKRILDIGCSDGYGSFLIAKKAKETIALDIDRKTIEEAREKYKRKNLKFIRGDALSLIWRNKFDVVVSFQVIEHLNDVDLYLTQIKKVLKKGGCFILSTPNRLLRLRKEEQPWNKFHVYEYEAGELEILLERFFSKVTMLGLQATPEIYEFEKKRLYFRRLIGKFDILHIYERMPRVLTDWAFYQIKKIIGKRGKKIKKDVSPKDFWISKDQIDDSLDIVAVCIK